VRIAVPDTVLVDGELDLVISTRRIDRTPVPIRCWYQAGGIPASKAVNHDRSAGFRGRPGVAASAQLAPGTRFVTMVHVRDCLIDDVTHRNCSGDSPWP
jgi:hypothetical protein